MYVLIALSQFTCKNYPLKNLRQSVLSIGIGSQLSIASPNLCTSVKNCIFSTFQLGDDTTSVHLST